MSPLKEDCNPAETAEDCLSLVFSFEETSGRKCCDCSADARARTEAPNSGFTDAPHYCRDFTPSRHAIMQRSSLSVIATILANGREAVHKFPIVVPPNGQHTHFRRTLRRVAEERFILPRRGGGSADASNHYFGFR
jgi:hypothetical protein